MCFLCAGSTSRYLRKSFELGWRPWNTSSSPLGRTKQRVYQSGSITFGQNRLRTPTLLLSVEPGGNGSLTCHLECQVHGSDLRFYTGTLHTASPLPQRQIHVYQQTGLWSETLRTDGSKRSSWKTINPANGFQLKRRFWCRYHRP